MVISNIEEELEKMSKKQEQIDKLKNRIASDTEKVNKLEASLQKKNSFILKATEEECINICLDALVVGAYDMKAKNGSIAPYTTGYYVTPAYKERIPDTKNPIEHTFCASVTGNKFEDLPKNLYKYLTEKKNWGYADFKKLKDETDRLFNELPTDYTPDFYKRPANSWDRGHIADGYETNGFDNIVKRRCGGDWSSMTTCAQNDLSVLLTVCKGFCPDYYFANYNYDYDKNEKIEMVKGIYERHGIDSDLSDLNEWALRNPTRCMSDKECFISREERSHEEDRDDI